MSKLHAVTIAEVKRETPDCVSVRFDIPESLKDTFTYTAGQHVIVRKEINGEDVRRTYSFCSAPNNVDYHIAVRQVDEGLFSTYVNAKLQAGDTLEISEPLGDFTLKTEPTRTANYVAFAAGSGITPVMAMIKDVLAREPNSSFFLYYGNRDAEHTIFSEEIAALKNQFMGRFSYQFFLTRQAVDIPFFNGRINAKKTAILHKQVFAPLGVAGYYLCGPLSMVNDVRAALVEAGEPEANIHSELFFASAEDAQRAGTAKKSIDGLAKSKIKVISDGRKITVDYRDEHGSILDAALKSGIDVSFACKGGVCATCRAKVIDGKVDMALNYGLEPEEIADSFVLTCQSVPLTKNVTISFDE
ncbi:MAG: 2Fe-2S iron-sulfur cluster-binding protein [Robiginitomaculum sp.]